MRSSRGDVEWGKLIAVLAVMGVGAFVLGGKPANPKAAKPVSVPAPVRTPPPATTAPLPPTTFRSDPPLQRRRSFGSSPCTYDCSGHRAGYDWAERKGIDDPDDCGGNSQSFIEGCQEYAEEQAEEAASQRAVEQDEDESSESE